MAERAPGVAKIRANHERSPFSREADAPAPPPLMTHLHGNRLNHVARGVEPRQRRSDRAARAGFSEAVPEHHFHFRAVLVAEPSRGEPEQQSITVHAVSPERGLSRDLATFTSAASRSVSAASARWPARVSR